MKKKKQNQFYFLVAVITVIGLLYLLQASDMQVIPMETEQIVIERPIYHAHVDFKVFINGNEVNFNKIKYDEINRYAHLHLSNPNGDKVIHIEGDGTITIGFFFESLGMKFNSTCFILDTGESYCNDGNKKIRFFVNGKENFNFDLYEPRDLNRVLVTYGDERDEKIHKQIDSVTDDACIYSQRCPERIGELPVPEDRLKF